MTYKDRSGARGRRRGSFRGRGRGRGPLPLDKTIVECYHCHKLGHFRFKCPSWDKKASYAQLKEEEKMLLVAHVEMNETRRQDVWFLDSGCSNHMCGDKTLFCDLNKSFRQMVKLGNNTRMAILGKRNVRLKVNSDIHVVTKVFYVPELKNNLLNIGQLQRKREGYDNTDRNDCKSNVCIDCNVTASKASLLSYNHTGLSSFMAL